MGEWVSGVNCNFVVYSIFMHELDIHKQEIDILCAAHNVKTLYAFGSVLNEKFNTASDIDLIVDFREIDVVEYADNYFNFKFSLQDILKRRVDLLEEKAIKNPYFKKSIEKNRKIIYG